jgi:hypothetical protein
MMSHLAVTVDLVAMKQKLEFFKKMGFSDLYTDEIERSLVAQEQHFAQLLLANSQ